MNSTIFYFKAINIIKNAIEALDKVDREDAKLEIYSSTVEESGQKFACCKLSDNGPGIDQKDFQKIFEFGYSTKNIYIADSQTSITAFFNCGGEARCDSVTEALTETILLNELLNNL